jgi:hypothetical protein
MDGNRRGDWVNALVLCAALLVLAPARAHALYLDPATGSLILQVLVAGALTIWITLRGWGSRFKAVFARLFKRSDEKPGDE